MSESSGIFVPMANVRAAREAGGDPIAAAGTVEAVTVEAVTVGDSAPPADDLLGLLDGNAKAVVAAIGSGGLSADERAALSAAESAGKNRKTVLAALA